MQSAPWRPKRRIAPGQRLNGLLHLTGGARLLCQPRLCRPRPAHAGVGGARSRAVSEPIGYSSRLAIDPGEPCWPLDGGLVAQPTERLTRRATNSFILPDVLHPRPSRACRPGPPARRGRPVLPPGPAQAHRHGHRPRRGRPPPSHGRTRRRPEPSPRTSPQHPAPPRRKRPPSTASPAPSAAPSPSPASSPSPPARRPARSSA